MKPRSDAGRQKGKLNQRRLPEVKIEMGEPALNGAAHIGKIGDGKIFVYDVADAVRIRNDDRGEAAL